jgi:hypothetical protein
MYAVCRRDVLKITVLSYGQSGLGSEILCSMRVQVV